MESPISASLGAMGPLLRKLDMLLGPSEGLLRLHKGAKRWTHLLKDDLEEITSYLQDLSEVEDPQLTAKCWMKEVRELSYDIENYIDSFVLPGHVANTKTRSGRRRCVCRRIRVRHIKIARLLETSKKLNRRRRVAARISDFRIDAREALERHKRYELHCCASMRRGLLPAAGRLRTTSEDGAGIITDDRMRKFMDSVADERDQQLKVVSVVGSEGIGKTTLVKVLYHKLKGRFDCRAFIRLTQKPDIKTVLRGILTQVQQQQQPHNHCEDLDLLGKIREHLQHKRYLIVIDDLWSASIWDIISCAFPGGKMCSRIITSTQVEDIALACCCYCSEYVFRMRPLDEDLSRELFFNSLFCRESDFPQKLKDVLNKIVQICGGFPLALIVIASLLATQPVILMEQWAYIYDSLSSKLRTSSSASEEMKLVVNFGYNNLTCHLKTCLLYLSMYPEGHTVCKDDLVKQWVAEGFIDRTEGKEVETAESYFHELIGRRFLQPECIKYTSEIASCSVHEVVHDLIAQKSLEENFVVVLDHYRRNVPLSEKVHRLSLHFPHTKYAMTNIRSSQVRSLSCFGLSKCMPSIREFKLLRVLNLNLSGYDDDNEDIIDLTWISELLRLRYLKVASDVCIELPKHMGGLQYLETVDISKKVTDVPSDIIHLPRLLHLHLPFETNLMDWLDMAGPAASVWSFGKPTSLQYLYLTCFIPVPDHLQENILSILGHLGSLFRGLGSLKTLAFILSSAHKSAVALGPSEETVTWDWDDFAPPLLERFEWLLHSCSFSRVPKWIGKLGNLCILKISVRELMRDGVNILAQLPALTTLSLYVKVQPVERIIFDKAGFSVLNYFKFKCGTLPWLKFKADAMPNLQKLKLGFSAHSHRVDQQTTVPISIEHLPSLKEISAKVADASSAAESALTAAISNHPRNPKIRMQLVDWNSYGHGVRYTVSKQENPLALEEHKIPDPEEGLDDHCVSQHKDSRDDQNKEAYVRHDGGKRRQKENTKILESPDTSTSSFPSSSVMEGSVQSNWAFEHFIASSSYASKAPPNITSEGKSYASSTSDITSTTLTISCTSEATNLQQCDSKIERCQAEGCRDCIGHDGGRRCMKQGCQKGADSRSPFLHHGHADAADTEQHRDHRAAQQQGMDPPPSSGRSTPTTPRRQLQGPRPPRLHVRMESHAIKKPSASGVVRPRDHQPQSGRAPVIIYDASPKVIHAKPNEFMALVQRLTGTTPPAPPPDAQGQAQYDDDASPLLGQAFLPPELLLSPSAAMSPAARLATIERSVRGPMPSTPATATDYALVDAQTGGGGGDDGTLPAVLSPTLRHPSILSSLPPAPTSGLFSPLPFDASGISWLDELSPILRAAAAASTANAAGASSSGFVPGGDTMPPAYYSDPFVSSPRNLLATPTVPSPATCAEFFGSLPDL